MSDIITCPSGLTGRIRKMKVSEARSFSERTKGKNADPMGRLINACWEETIDPGPYDPNNNVINWNQVLLGDRLYAFIGIRVATYGPDYAFSVNCRERDCRRRIDWELNLDDLPVRALTD